MSKTQLLEFVRQSGPFTVDVDNAVIRGVRVLGLESANGRSYLKEAVAKSLQLYRNKGTNIDHPSKPGEPARVGGRCGWLDNPIQEADGGSRADWYLLKSHPLTPLILEVAQRNPSLLGLSHNATGKTRREGGKEIVESIDEVHSVDVVVDPATTKGFHEGRQMKTTVRQLIETFRHTRPGYVRGLREMAEAGLMSADAEMEPPPEPPAEAPSESADHEQAILDACKAVLDDGSVKSPEKLQKIKKLLGVIDGGGGGGGEKKEGGDSEEKKTEEGRLRLQLQIRDECLDQGVRPTKVLKKALDSCTTLAEARELITEAKTQGSHAARSASPWAPASGTTAVTEQKVPAGNPKELAAWLRG